jgi:hypothetical protein
LEEIRRYASERLAQTRSLEEITLRAQQYLLEQICARRTESEFQLVDQTIS